MAGEDIGHDLAGALLWWCATQLLIERDALLLEANRVESWNAPWARNRRRRAARLLELARGLCGDRPLPWAIQD